MGYIIRINPKQNANKSTKIEEPAVEYVGYNVCGVANAIMWSIKSLIINRQTMEKHILISTKRRIKAVNTIVKKRPKLQLLKLRHWL